MHLDETGEKMSPPDSFPHAIMVLNYLHYDYPKYQKRALCRTTLNSLYRLLAVDYKIIPRQLFSLSITVDSFEKQRSDLGRSRQSLIHWSLPTIVRIHARRQQ